MDSSSSDDDEIKALCGQLKIKYPTKKQKLIKNDIYLNDLENIDINNLPIEILPDSPSLPVQEQLQLQDLEVVSFISLEPPLTIPESQNGEELRPQSALFENTSPIQKRQSLDTENINADLPLTPVVDKVNTPFVTLPVEENEEQQPTDDVNAEDLPVALSDESPETENVDTNLPLAPSGEELQPLLTCSAYDIEEPTDDDHTVMNANRKRKKKGFAQKKEWDKNVTKEKRMKGEEYVGYRRDRKVSGRQKFKVLHDVPRPARSIGPKCTSKFCDKSKLRKCQSLSDDEREIIFSEFWKNMSWEQRKQYVVSHVLLCEKKQTTVKNKSRRRESKQYFLSLSRGRIQVCMTTFLSTLGLKESTVRCWITTSNYGIAKTETKDADGEERVILSRPKLYQSTIKITETKWKHLQDLKHVIPFDCHSYYDLLPH